MDIAQAVRRLRSGDKIRREAWEDKERFIEPEAVEDDDPILSVIDLLATDWETEDG